MSHCKNSVRDTVIRGWFVMIQREAHSAGCGPFAEGKGLGHGLRPWNLVWLGFASWVNSCANVWEDHPNHGEPHTPPSFDSALKLSCHLWVCHLAYRLGLKVYLNLTCHLGLNWFQSVYVMPLCYVILSKVVPCPLPSCFILFTWALSRPTMLSLQSSGGTTRK